MCGGSWAIAMSVWMMVVRLSVYLSFRSELVKNLKKEGKGGDKLKWTKSSQLHAHPLMSFSSSGWYTFCESYFIEVHPSAASSRGDALIDMMEEAATNT